jgi:hypothetical protein
MQSDYIPDDASYYRFVNTQINQVYRELWDSKDWVFSDKTVQMHAWKDKVAEDYLNATLSMKQGGYEVSSGIKYVFEARDVGASLCIQGYDYTITSVKDAVTAYVSTPFHGVLGVGDDVGTWSIKYRDYYLPSDVVEILAIAWRNTPVVGAPQNFQGSIGIPKKMDDIASLNMQLTAVRPQYYFEQPDPYVRTPEAQYAPTATLHVSVTDKLDPGTYTFAYSYVLGTEDTFAFDTTQRSYLPESALCPETCTVVVPNPTTGNITFSVHQPLGPSIAGESGNRAVAIKVYQILTTGDGRVYAVELRNSFNTSPLYATDLTGSGTATVTIKPANFVNVGRPVRAPNNGGRSKQVRFWPRPGVADQEPNDIAMFGRTIFDLRYIYRPEDLIEEGDVPEMPEEFHLLIADMVSARLAMRHGKLAEHQLFQKSVFERRKMLETRYGTTKDSMVVRSRSMQASNGWTLPMVYPGIVTWMG